jgi:hypothetical protein
MVYKIYERKKTMKNIKKLFIMIFVIAFAFTIASCNNEPHTHSYVEGVCDCGEKDPNYVPPHTHDYSSVVTAPTCTEAGYTTYTCSCGHTYTEAGEAAKGHDYSSVVTAPTCTEAGYTTYTCTCGHTYTEAGEAAKGHEYSSIVTEPTCTEAGYTTYVCACGDTYTEAGEPALGHKFIDGECICGEVFVLPVSGWALVTEIKDGDNVLIGAPAYNKLLSAEKVNASSFYNKGVNYSAEDYSNVTDAEIFVVTVNADGTYTFTSKSGVVIALADSYSSLNDTGANKSWELIEKGDGVFYLKNSVRGNYLEWYASKDNWSTYATSSLSDLFELSFYAKAEATDAEHVHNHISDVHETTCTETGYTTYTCRCGDTYTVTGEEAKGHQYSSVVTAPTCTEAGYTTYTCKCGDTYTEAGEAAKGHTWIDGVCDCGEVDLSIHTHSYTSEVTAPTCSAVGYTTYTCKCGDTYTGDEVAIVDHIDTNLDITCDFEGCTKRIIPAADSKVSLFTANHMIIVSLNGSYYVEGVVTKVYDANSGIFVISDDAGDTILIRLPKDSAGNAYTAWATKVVLGDTISVYGKPSRNTSSNYTEKAKVESGVLTVLKHEHVYSEATCLKPATCDCLATQGEALGHTDENADNACDRCSWNMKLTTSYIAVSTDTTVTNGVLDANKTSWTWSNDNFDVIIAKGTSTVTLYTTAKAYMQLKKLNTFTIDNKNGLKIHSVTISTTSASQLTNLKNAIKDQYEYTENAEDLTVTIIFDSTDDFVFSNQGTSTAYISGVEIAYEIPTTTVSE